MFARFDLSALSRRRSAKFVLAFLAPVVAITVVTLTARAWRDKKGSAAKQEGVVAQQTTAPGASGYVRRARLRIPLRDALDVLGDRIEKPGKERVVYVGALRRQGNSGAIPLRLILELPGLMRLEEGAGGQLRVIGFDGGKGWVLGGQFSAAEQSVIETLVFDSTERLLLSQTQGAATRFLGQRFRIDSDPVTRATVFYDIYQISDQITINSSPRFQTKLYYLNSDSQLLERVRYKIERDGRQIEVEVLLSNWWRANNQRFPGSITRLEDGEEIFRLTINAATHGPRINDGIFNPPTGQDLTLGQ
jgi:hypothetical protein